ncbi:MAG: 2-oxo acid dehydrogenase subunit E2 [Phycisphaeraceae bacterium]|nr:2-oxo acid dehydrogenase subunit E2 [Phycisphaerales bacterium]MCB9858993.1 2-oxo acid dehydrogenase subunit E2 [Phycisphaeraceae bacterium]
MPISVTMPRLSDTMQEGTVVKWHVKPGDAVESGQVIADIETDKATMELETFDAGTIADLPAQEGRTVPVGSVICVIAEEGESVDAAKAAGSKSASQTATKAAGSDAISSASASATAVAEPPAHTTSTPSHATSNGSAHGTSNGSAHTNRIFASPLAKKIAAESNIDLGSLTGSGPSGRIVRSDVERAAQSGATGASQQSFMPMQSPGTLESKLVQLSNMRTTIARRLVESKTTIPHYQVTVSARLDALMELRSQLNEQLSGQGVKLSVNDFLVRACALAMHQHPFVNSSWVDNAGSGSPGIQIHGNVNIGVAVALPEERGGGLVVATIRNSDSIGLRQISAETKRLANKAREKGLSVEEMSDSTFTISNLGMFGVDHFTAIINPPNAAILAVGQAIEKPFIERDENGEPELVIGHEMSMTMSSDHRIIDGAMAAAYLSAVKDLLERPATLLV